MPATLTGELANLIGFLNDPAKKIVAHLSKNYIPIDVDKIALADLIECDFPGYAPVVIDAWEPVDYGDEEYGEAVSGELEWVATKIVDPQMAVVVYVTITDIHNVTVLLPPIVLPHPFAFHAEGDLFAFGFTMTSTHIPDLLDVPFAG